MISKFSPYREAITTYLSSYFHDTNKMVAKVNNWGPDVGARLSNFVKHGKLLRGSLILLSHEMCGSTQTEQSVKVAAAFELIHSSLLIHDDIMDHDKKRRGKETIFYQYQKLSRPFAENPRHFGESLGICAGDIGFYLAFAILSQLTINPALLIRIISFWAKELTTVGIAQMQDMYFGNTRFLPHQNEILSLYQYKTARYSFSLPLATGAILSERKKRLIDALIAFGEDLGIIFQIKDDELGLFGDEAQTGKPVGSDIIEGKKTLYIAYLLSLTNTHDKTVVEEIIHKKKVSPEIIHTLYAISQRCGAAKKITQTINTLKMHCRTAINDFPFTRQFKNTLQDLVTFVITRKA